MASFGIVRWKAFAEMLDACLGEGNWYYEDRPRQAAERRYVYHGEAKAVLHLGQHGHRRNPDLQIGHVRTATRRLDIVDCAKKNIEQLRH